MPTKIAVIGCGAIAESFFLPVLSKRSDLCSSLWIVDSNQARLDAIAKTFNVPTVATSLDHVIDKIDAAVICTPHDTHYPLSKSLIAAGKHVLCEKPLTTKFEEGEELVEAAARRNIVFMASYGRRIGPAFREVKRIITSGELGAPMSATWTEGKKFNWPTASGFYFKQKSGILLDMGAHVVDLMCWWFGGNPTVVSCQTDSFGGPEARVTLRLDFGGLLSLIDLSYYHRMSNLFAIQFQNGVITGKIDEHHRCVISRPGKRPKLFQQTRTDPATHMISNFTDAIAGKHPLEISGRDVLPSIKTISEAYSSAQSYDEPWLPRTVGQLA